MSSSDYDDQYEDDHFKKIKPKSRKPSKLIMDSEEEISHKKKRGGKRSHRKSTLKEELWEEALNPRARK